MFGQLIAYDTLKARIASYEAKTCPLHPQALMDTVAEGRKIMAVCNFMQSFFKEVPRGQSRTGVISNAFKKVSNSDMILSKVKEAAQKAMGLHRQK